MTIYSMESFVYWNLNNAMRSRDDTKILTLGPFAKAIQTVLGTAEDKRKGDKDAMPPIGSGRFVSLYRGCQLTQPHIESFKPFERINLNGFTSTTTKRDAALAIALQGATEEEKAVLFKIKWEGNACNHFRMNSEEYSAYS